MANFYGKYSGIFGGGSGGGGGNPFQEIPVGAVDGVNVTFTVSQAPGNAQGFDLFLDGLILNQGTEYTISGTTITMTTPPAVGQGLYCTYTVVASGGGGFVTGVANTASVQLAVASGTLTANVIGSGLIDVFGTSGAPIAVTAAGGIIFASTKEIVFIFIQGSGGAVTITANPQIVNTSTAYVGQILKLIPTSNVNTVTINTGNGTNVNGSWTGNANNAIELVYDGANWFENNRRA